MSPLDLLLINPAAADTIYQDLSDDLMGVEPPLWCRLIAGYVRDRDFSVEILDAHALGLSAKQVSQLVSLRRPRLVGMIVYGHQPSASTQQMTGAIATCHEIRKLEPECKIIVVGGHVSALPARTLSDTGADYACKGEGPITIVQLLEGHYLPEIPDLVFRENGGPKIVTNKPPALLSTDKLHGNTWDLLPMGKYRAHNWHCFGRPSRRPYASIYTSLGCPFKCSFCCINSPFGSNRYRMREPSDVVDEIVMLYNDYRVNNIKITDEMFVLNDKHVNGICEGLISNFSPDDLNIWAYARIDTIKPQQLKLLRAAGVRWICLGIESGSDHVRDGSNKAFDDNDILDAVRMIQAADINVIGNFIFGLPDDTKDSMRATFNLAVRLNCEFVNFYSAMAYPGSPLHKQVDPADLPNSWSGYSQHSYDCKPLPTDTLTSEEVLSFRDDAFKMYYTSGYYLGMVSRKFGVRERMEIESMVNTPLPRRLLEQQS